MTISGQIQDRSIILNYKLSKEQIYWFFIVIGIIVLSYLLNLIGLINIENPISLWLCLFSPFTVYL